MKFKRKPELLVVILLSVFIWMFYYMDSVPLARYETIFVVGVIALLVFPAGHLIRSFKKKKKKKNNEK